MRRFVWLLVYVVAVCGACGTQAPSTAPIPARAADVGPVPDSLPTMLGFVPVTWQDKVFDASGGEELMGLYNLLERRIYLSRRIQNPIVAWHVALHERCHAVMADTGLRFAMTPLFVQQLCDAIATLQVIDLLAATRR